MAARGTDEQRSDRMHDRPGNESYWTATAGTTDFPPLREDARAEVAIVGGGIAGLLAARFLAEAGKDVLLVDRYRVGSGESALTTAHATYVVDPRLRDLVRLHSEAGAKASWDSSVFAIDLLEQLAREVPCDFARLDGVLYGVHGGDERVLEEEARLARRFGYPVQEWAAADVPFPCLAALGFEGQAKFHPRKLLVGLAKRLAVKGVRLYEGTEVKELRDDAG